MGIGQCQFQKLNRFRISHLLMEAQRRHCKSELIPFRVCRLRKEGKLSMH